MITSIAWTVVLWIIIALAIHFHNPWVVGGLVALANCLGYVEGRLR